MFGRLATILFAFLFLSSKVLAQSPKIEIDNSSFNFGEVVEGSIVEHNFKVTNRGGALLEIKKISPACGCTAAVVEKDKLSPGDSTFIKAKFNTNGFTGSKDKKVGVYSNDPENVVVTLTIKGKITGDVVVDPLRVFLGDVAKGKAAKAEVKIYSEPGRNISFGDARTRDDLLSLSQQPITGGGKLLKITFSKEAPIGDFMGRISVPTTSKLNPLINIPVIAYVHGDLLLIPRSLSLGVLEGPLKKVVKGEVIIENTSNKPINIESVNTSNSVISADFSVIRPGFKYSIDIQLASGSIGVLQSVVMVKTNHPDIKQQEITIPVYAIINPAQDY